MIHGIKCLFQARAIGDAGVIRIVEICIIRFHLESFFVLFLYLQTECFASASRTAHELRPIVLKVWWLTTTTTTTTSYNAPPQRTTVEAEAHLKRVLCKMLIFLLWLFGFKTYLVRRRTKTQKCKGALFEQLESGWA